MRVVGQCEFDSACRTVLTRHWPGVPCSDDVTELNADWLRSVGLVGRNDGPAAEERNRDNQNRDDRGSTDSESGVHGVGLPQPCSDTGGTNDGSEHRNGDRPGGSDIQLVCGGFPCQDLSVAGKRAGLAGERSGLFYEAARVADLVLGDGGWLLIENVPGLLSSNDGADFGIVLATLADLGFHDLAWRVVDSRYFGVPQRRRRVFILARRARGDRARAVLLEPESGGGDFAPSGLTGPGDTPGAGQSIASALDKQSGGPDDNSAQANHLIAGPLTKRYAKGINTTMDDGAMVVSENQRSAWPPQHAATLGSNDARHNGNDDNGGKLIPDKGVRRLTPVECERLQGFPDGWTVPDDADWRDHPKPDGPRYAQMGNAVTVPVAHWIGDRIMRYGTER
jgi:DNA (cytosine-5)-methyltransferase 1